MTSSELEGYLNGFNANIDGFIATYESISSSITELTNEANIIKGSDQDLFTSINDNNRRATQQVDKIKRILKGLKKDVNKKTKEKINILRMEEAARRKEEEDNG